MQDGEQVKYDSSSKRPITAGSFEMIALHFPKFSNVNVITRGRIRLPISQFIYFEEVRKRRYIGFFVAMETHDEAQGTEIPIHF